MKFLAMVVAVVAMTGCGIQPLQVWRVSRHANAIAPSCYPPNTNLTDSTSNWDAETDMGVWQIYQGPANSFYLADVSVASESCRQTPVTCTHQTVSVPGKLDKGIYTFTSTATSDLKTGTSPNTQELTTSAVTTITLTLDGDTFDGKWSEAITRTCNGTTCGANWATDNPNCTYEYVLKGSKVDAEKFYVVNTGLIGG